MESLILFYFFAGLGLAPISREAYLSVLFNTLENLIDLYNQGNQDVLFQGPQIIRKLKGFKFEILDQDWIKIQEKTLVWKFDHILFFLNQILNKH